jgi:uncharacterized RDD family membrane protein YckC
MDKSANHHALRHAALWRRAIAGIFDFSLIATCVVVLLFTFGIALAMIGYGERTIAWLPITFFCLGMMAYWIYCAASEASIQQGTPGQRMLGIKVVDLQGRRIGFGRASVRHLYRYASLLFLGVGFLVAAFSANKQAMHDKIAGCLLVIE